MQSSSKVFGGNCGGGQNGFSWCILQIPNLRVASGFEHVPSRRPPRERRLNPGRADVHAIRPRVASMRARHNGWTSPSGTDPAAHGLVEVGPLAEEGWSGTRYSSARVPSVHALRSGCRVYGASNLSLDVTSATFSTLSDGVTAASTMAARSVRRPPRGISAAPVRPRTGACTLWTT